MINFVCDIPLQEVYIPNKYIVDGDSEENSFTKGYWYSIISIPNQILLCNVTLETGANYSRLPLHFLWHDKPISEMECHPGVVQKYDCFSYEIQVIKYTFLTGQSVKILGENPQYFKNGSYLFTVCSVDSSEKGFAEFPEQVKDFHIIEMENGQYAAMPNNFIRFMDKALYDTEVKLPQYKRLKNKWFCEK